jgi:DNA-binding transcriptional LysR family regulator
MALDRLMAMEVFVRVIETGSFSGAARQLRLGQPTVSKIIAQLEERLGVRLLLRSSRGLTATEAGQNFHERAKRSLEEVEEAELAARGASASLSGRLRFSANVTFARLHIIPHLPLFLAAHPALSIDAILEDRPVDMIEEGVDVGLRIGANTDATVTSQRIGKSRRIVLGARAYFLGVEEPREPADLARHKSVIYVHPTGGMIWSLRRGNSEAAVTLNGSLRMSAAEGVREAVFAGLGLCVAPEWMFQPELSSGEVKQLLADWTLPDLDLSVTYPKGRRISAKARAFAAFIEQRLGTSGLAE